MIHTRPRLKAVEPATRAEHVAVLFPSTRSEFYVESPMATYLFLSTKSSRAIRTCDFLFLDAQLLQILLYLTALLLLKAPPLLGLEYRLHLLACF